MNDQMPEAALAPNAIDLSGYSLGEPPPPQTPRRN